MSDPLKNYDTVIVGGGAAGIVAAISAARGGASVLLCEKMPKLGKKVRISGNGRCNLTNDNLDAAGFNPEAKTLVESVFSRFGKHEILDFFKELGLRVYTEKKDGRVFPITNQSASVMDVLELELSKLGVTLCLDSEVTGLGKTQDRFSVTLKSGGSVSARHVILTAGGKSYPLGGTDGSAYALAISFGHHLIEPVPCTVPLLSKDPWCAQLSGQKIVAEVRYQVDGRTGPRIEGDLLFTDYGLSGTAILDVGDELSIALGRSLSQDTSIVIDLVPFLHEDELKKELSRRMKRKFPSDKLIAGLLPPKFSNVLADVLKRRDPLEIASTLKHRVFVVNGTRGWNDAEFTAGGIDHREIDVQTLESKKCRGLYLAGEILDVNGRRGGFNLAWAWASGFIAGASAAPHKTDRR